MPYGQTLAQNGGRASADREGRAPAGVPAGAAREIPYDYVARFVLTGRRGTRALEVLNISTEGAFVAAAIGYSFIPAPLAEPRVTVTLPGTATTSRVDVELNGVATELPAAAGPLDVPLNLLLALVPTPAGSAPVAHPQLAALLRSVVRCALVRHCGIDFKYSIVDSGSGRELQNLPIHNIAGLGESSGERPFRTLPKPMLYLPRSTIRIEVEEISEGPLYAGAELFLVMHGYKVLGYDAGYGAAQP
jgi:hypothetical protein